MFADDLRNRLERAGHELVHFVDKHADLERVLVESTDLVVAAGGDGTVWRAVCALIGKRIPLAILPVGTANNIARTLGIEGGMPEIIDGWKRARRRPLDLGVVRGDWGENRFIEGVGAGLISGGIAAMEESTPPPGSREDSHSKLARAVRCYRGVLSELTPRRWSLVVDGTRMDGDFLLLEVLNIRSVGPNLVLAPGADASDGRLDVVTAGEEHRRQIDDYLRRRLDGTERPLALPTTRARQVAIGGWEEMHLDDQVSSGRSLESLSVEIEPAAVQLLV